MPLTRPTRLALALAVATLAAGAQAENLTPNLQLNGFATAGGTWVSKDYGGRVNGNVFNDKGVTENPNFQIDNVLGLQLTYALDDKFDLVGQLVSEGKNDYQTQVEWAYIAYRINDNVRLRVGRLTAPFYMYSESLNVGHAYPWVRLPVELYAGLYVKSMDGLDLQYRKSLGDTWHLDSQLYAGEAYGSFGKVRNAYGLNLNFGTDALTLHAGYGAGKIDFNVSPNLSGNLLEQGQYALEQFGGTFNTKANDVSFSDIGAQFDNGEWFAMAEYGQLRMSGWGTDWDAGLATVGHYYGKWLPFVSYSRAKPVETDECYAELGTATTNATQQAAYYTGLYNTAVTTVSTQSGASANYTAQAAATLVANGGVPNATYVTLITQAATADALAAQAAVEAGFYAQGVSQITAAIPQVASVAGTICPGKEQTTYSVGFRYDATKNVSIKAQIDHVQDFNNTNGFTIGTTTQPDQLDMFSFNINAAF